MFRYFAFFVSSLLISTEVVGRRWHTSQIVLKQLYDLQEEHFDALNVYLDLETKRLDELKNNLAAIQEWHDRIKPTKNTYLDIHINVVRTMFWFHSRLLKVDKLMTNMRSLEALNDIDGHKDLSGDHIILAYEAIRRLQRFYGIRASDMAAGRYNDRVIGDPLDACECFVMSEYCFQDNDVYGVIDWAVEVYNKLKNDSQPNCVDIDRLNEYIVSSSMYTGFDFRLFFVSNEVRYQKDTEPYEQHLFLMRNELISMHEGRTLEVFKVYHDLEMNPNLFNFRKLCKAGVSLRTLTNESKCRYQAKNSYYRLLMPFKEEDINNEPLVKLYHDVLYEEEILKMKAMAVDNMYDAQVKSMFGYNNLKENSRSGQVSWLYDSYEKELIDSLNSRIECFTEFSTKFSEPYQIVNYGLGGHYIPHLDALPHHHLKNSFPDLGNRVVTVLLYLTDVENDGYTAYPVLNIVSPIEKGTALVWLNLNLTDGDLLYKTFHGSCPLLKGNKWIMTKWLHEKGQNLIYDWGIHIR